MPPRYAPKNKKRKGAPKGNQFAVGNKGGGRPTEYKPKFVQMAKRAAEAGFTDMEIAELLGVSEQTLNTYKRLYKDFSFALRAGKDGPDERVERSMFMRAVGFEIDTEELFYDKDTKEVLHEKTRKYYPPDVTAGYRWLENRRADRWRSKPEFVAPDGMFEKRFTFNIFERNLDPNAPENKAKMIEGKFKRIENKQAVPADDDDGPVMP